MRGITTLVPKPQTSNNRAAGLFDKKDFRYLPETDEYACPAGQRAIRRFTRVERGQTVHRYWSSACPRCPIKTRCTRGVYRRITRWEHEAALERMQERLNRTPDAMSTRRRTVEHPVGTLRCLPENPSLENSPACPRSSGPVDRALGLPRKPRHAPRADAWHPLWPPHRNPG